ncbi:hypothetical protein A3J13_01180 [Candidatus Daviesbacteria bacterium RIFCSPLOWO2_02_FULL_36_8]|uniref:Uncharacterized protein n=1 Tax=Candidatus Daviesbacteria bacterium RIFCSPLOWO2_02_FULL_36_8 TaxID=1797793 RepID=A0A1F5MFX3_9BACT|nr:MAG: hypothetical protein A3J13_01180 [Candidatus Daviesbacteria bacterium RIFCSPLOWO2_02_FULL_36_8]
MERRSNLVSDLKIQKTPTELKIFEFVSSSRVEPWGTKKPILWIGIFVEMLVFTLQFKTHKFPFKA